MAGFGERHGDVETVADEFSVRLTASDGAVAELEVPWPPLPVITHSTVIMHVVAAVADHAAASRLALLVLVRRGGYAAGLAEDGTLLSHAVGNRYVQGRTAAGGWSQHRFARRRSGQAAALAGSAVEAVLKVSTSVRPDVVVVGGDRGLVDEVLGDSRLRRVATLPRSPLLAVRDPRLAVLKEVAERCRAVRVRLDEPQP